MANDCLVWIHVSPPGRKPFGRRSRVPNPTLQVGRLQRISERHVKPLVATAHHVCGFVMNYNSWDGAPLVFPRHLLQDAGQLVFDELAQVRCIVQLRRVCAIFCGAVRV